MLDLRQEKSLFFFLNLGLIVLILGLFGVNQIVMAKTMNAMGMKNNSMFNLSSFDKSLNKDGTVDLTGDIGKDAVSLALFSGQPKIYGAELNIAFDRAAAAMNAMKVFDPTYGSQKITLSGADLQRYTDVGLRIACEFCCGAKALIDKNGQAACGCAHSQAMRGLAAYLIQKHGAEYTNDEILRELARWKGRYFPKQMIKKISEQLQSGQYTPDIAALVLNLKLPKYSASNVGAPLPSEIKDLPSMVGGC
ncbi:MAG: hypothetical protein HZC05_02480 [Candidatus Magasanikbacteria bacterium]|nr:hypothetical protein [Candidatus Magasanikbacteria bacterium]